MQLPVNKSEKFVYWVCKKSFLSLWSYLNPIGKKGKELCDILVVCNPYILIFSVKEVEFKLSESELVDRKRWVKRAIQKSCDQIYGAERWIQSAKEVIKRDGNLGVNFPEDSIRKVHRIAIAFGGKGEFPLVFRESGNGFVHVFDERSFTVLLQELDTIKDFVGYLAEKENLLNSYKGNKILGGGEEDLLAAYIYGERKFQNKSDLVVLDDGLWENLKKRPEYKAKKIEDEESYKWDRLIEKLCQDISTKTLEMGGSFSENEMVVRVMAEEDRFCRRILGKYFGEFLRLTEQKKIRSRAIPSSSGVSYVFLATPHGEDRKFRVAELSARCMVVRSKKTDGTTVIGIATEQPQKGKGYSLDVVYMRIDQWNSEFQARVDSIPKELNIFNNPDQKQVHEDEFPEI